MHWRTKVGVRRSARTLAIVVVVAGLCTACPPPDGSPDPATTTTTTTTSTTTTIAVPVPYDTVVVSGSHQVGNTGSAYPARVVARVRDSSGQPVPGATVRFDLLAAPTFPSRAEVSFMSGGTIDVVSDAVGVASAVAIANEWVGAVRVRAVVPGQPGPAAVFELENRIGRNTGTFALPPASGASPVGPIFDGSNIWVAGLNSNKVSKFRARDGALLGSYVVGGQPDGLAYDGSSIWVANCATDNVMRLDPASGTVLATFAVAGCPARVLPIGNVVWVAPKAASSPLTALDATSGAVVRTAPNPGEVEDVVYDGTDIWLTTNGGHPLRRIRESTGALLSDTGFSCTGGLAVEDDHVWVADPCLNKVTKVRRSDLANLGDFPVGNRPMGVLFDGVDILVSNADSNTVTRVRVADGATVATSPTGTNPLRLAFDGTNVWSANLVSNDLTAS